MSHFLQNLIARHQDVGIRQVEGQLVQPRPKAKFEIDARPAFVAQNDPNNGSDFTTVAQADTNAGLHSSPHDQEAKPIMSAESKHSLRYRQVFPQHDIDKSSVQHDFSRHIDRLNEQTNSTSRPLGRKSSELKSAISTSEIENYKQTDTLRELPEISNQADHRQVSSLDEVSHHIQKTLKHINNQHPQHTDDQRVNESQRKAASDADNNTSSSEINHRIQTMLHRLNSPQHADDGQRTNESQRDSASDADNNAAANEANHRIQTILHRLNSQQSQNVDELLVSKLRHESTSDVGNNALTNTVQLPSLTQPTAEFVEPVIKVIKQSEESQLEQRESHQQGSLQIPNWLTEMQADLNNRMQDINAKAQPESVINVTIGRVEVKAIQAESVKQPKARNKPSGVMGLDDYLKQRESRGRA